MILESGLLYFGPPCRGLCVTGYFVGRQRSVRTHLYMYMFSASEMTYIVSSGALNSTHSLTHLYMYLGWHVVLILLLLFVDVIRVRFQLKNK